MEQLTSASERYSAKGFTHVLIFLPQEGLLPVIGGFNRTCQVQMKYRAVTPNEIEFYSSIRHLGFIHCVKQFL